ncbi:MAG: hypothetical protein ISR96_04020 [Nitrospira sp.]|nr:hypothetical protein [bacterium]MBL7048680.1 hypothetical protein [Nitrospira sp.]
MTDKTTQFQINDMKGLHEKLFGEFLVKVGLVTETDIVEALNIQKQKTPPVGEIALKQKMLNMQKIFQILNHQVGSGKRFGEIAVELGFMSEQSAVLLLQIQDDCRPRIGDILVEQKKLDRDILEIAHRKFSSKEV